MQATIVDGASRRVRLCVGVWLKVESVELVFLAGPLFGCVIPLGE